jgi:hypothetical protein
VFFLVRDIDLCPMPAGPVLLIAGGMSNLLSAPKGGGSRLDAVLGYFSRAFDDFLDYCLAYRVGMAMG